ncbi:MAG: glutamate racemase [Chloroflexota bacterium]
MDERPIGIFDSGIGGLTVFKEVSRLLPAEHIVYLGDTARVPYGIRSPETVIRYSFECARFLMLNGIKLLVVACNTASAVSLDEIRRSLPVPVIGVIEPGAQAAVASTRNRRIGVIGTEATVRSGAYVTEIRRLDGTVEVISIPCPLFVPLVEEGWTDGEIARLVAEKYLSVMRGQGPDTLVLGCTHYPLLKAVIGGVMGAVSLIDSAVEVAKVAGGLLGDSDGLRVSGGKPTYRFFVTDSPHKFISVGERFLGGKIGDIEKVAVSEM